MSTSATAIDSVGSSIAHGRFVPAIVCSSFSAFCVLVDYAYATIGKRGNSPWMEWMFLIPLFGGALVWLSCALVTSRMRCRRGFRPAFNFWNAGLASLTAGCLLKGIFDIAGTDSVFVPWFWATGGVMMLVAVVVFVARRKEKTK